MDFDKSTKSFKRCNISEVSHVSRMPIYREPRNTVEFKTENVCKNSLEMKRSTWFQLRVIY